MNGSKQVENIVFKTIRTLSWASIIQEPAMALRAIKVNRFEENYVTVARSIKVIKIDSAWWMKRLQTR